MSETRWTSGPWVIIPAIEYDGDDDELEGSYTSPAGIEGDDGSPVCAFGIAEGSGVLFENEANYHLIAAAPELYEALSDALALLEQLYPKPARNGEIARARAALSRARGEKP